MQAICGRFDSDSLHQFRSISIARPNALGCQPRDHRFESGMDRQYVRGVDRRVRYLPSKQRITVRIRYAAPVYPGVAQFAKSARFGSERP